MKYFATKNPRIYRSILRLVINLFGITLIGVSAIFLLLQISNHENLIKAKDFSLYPNLIAIPILLLAFVACGIVTLFLFLLLKECYENRKARGVFREKKSMWPLVLGTSIGLLCLSFFYPQYQSIDKIKLKNSNNIESILAKESNFLEHSFNNGNIGILQQFIRLEEPAKRGKVLIDIKGNQDLIDNTIENLRTPDSNKSLIWFNFKDDSLLSQKNGLQGQIFRARNEERQKALGEESVILAYLKKDNFDKSKGIIVSDLKINPGSEKKCYQINYRVTYANGEVSKNFYNNNCDLYQNSFLPPTFRFSADSTNDIFQISILEIWITSPTGSESMTELASVYGIDGIADELLNIPFCIEATHPGFGDKKFIMSHYNSFNNGFKVGKVKKEKWESCPPY